MQKQQENPCRNCGKPAKFDLCFICWQRREMNMGTLGRYVRFVGKPQDPPVESE